MTITIGSDVLVDATNSEWNSVVGLSATKAIIFYKLRSATSVLARVLDISGTTVTVQASQLVDTIPSGFDMLTVGITKLTSTTVMVAYSDTGAGKTALLSISGSTITVETISTFKAASVEWVDIVALSATKVIISYTDTSDSDKVYAVIVDISGTILTPGTPQLVQSGGGKVTSIDMLDSTHAIVTYADVGNGDFPTANALSISGTTITVGTDKVLVSAASWTLRSPGWKIIAAMSSTSAIAVWNTQNGSGEKTQGVGMTISGTTITIGTEIDITPGSAGNDKYPAVVKINSSNALFMYSKNNASGLMSTLALSGTTLTENADEITFNAGQVLFLTLAQLNENDFICAHHQTTDTESRAFVAQTDVVFDTAFDLRHSATGIPGSII